MATRSARVEWKVESAAHMKSIRCDANARRATSSDGIAGRITENGGIVLLHHTSRWTGLTFLLIVHSEKMTNKWTSSQVK